jgi:hypothetical protein
VIESALTRRLLALTDPARLGEVPDKYADRDHAAEARQEIEALRERAKARGLTHPLTVRQRLLSGSLDSRIEACRLVAGYLPAEAADHLGADWMLAGASSGRPRSQRSRLDGLWS